MALYHNTVQWIWDLEAGEYVSWLRYSFGEYNLETIFKIIRIHKNGTADLEVVDTVNPEVSLGSIYLEQPLEGFRRTKRMTVHDVTDKAYSPSGTLPSPKDKDRIEYNKGI